MKDDEGGSYPVSRIPHFELVLPQEEDIRIALKVWYPSTPYDDDFFPGAENRESIKEGTPQGGGSFPSILEYLPYRHSDFTVVRDETRHPWIASHGYVVVRADLRGSGNSNGLYFDEYTETEQKDGVAIIEWIKAQGWSNGRVGMYGKSWGGFNGLQIAFREPEALTSVISLYSTDNRFTDDIHYKGGCVIGSGMLSWASWMLADQTKPPHPKFVQDWKKEWKARLESACESWADIWLSKQKFDDYWANGSICMDYERIQIPVCIFGGWVDAYTNAAFRMAQRLPNVTSIIGPWSHDWPDVAFPGPNIGFLQKCLEFWEGTLKDTAHLEDRQQVWYQVDGVLPPAEWTRKYPGRWLRLQKNCKYDDAVEPLIFNVVSNGPRAVEQSNVPMDLCIDETTEYITLKIDPLSAQEYNEFLSFGDPDQAGDMMSINAYHSDTWTLQLANEKPLAIYGQPVFEGIVQGPQIIVRLCDVFPDGQSRLLSIGVMNLEDNLEKRKVRIVMDVIGYDLHPGHALALSFSPMYFPLIWPSKSEPLLRLYQGTFSIPTLKPDSFECDFDPGEPICFKRDYPLSKELREPEFERSFKTLDNNTDGSVVYEWRTLSDSGKEELTHEKIISSEKREEIYRISSVPPFNPEAETQWSVQMSFPTAEPGLTEEKISISTTSKMSSTNEDFVLSHKIIVSHGEESLLTKDYEKVIPREL